MRVDFDNGDGNSGYKMLEDGTFVISDYNKSRTFSSFFPGIAGLHGIPMWAFYANRNQGICSFGIKNKSCSIMEFSPAVKAYGAVATQGFRTFIKIKEKNRTIFYEPFANNPPESGKQPLQTMFIRPYEVLFEDINELLGIKTTLRYYNLPGEPVAAMVRTVNFENIGKKALDIEVIDGMPKIIPYWVDDWVLKHMSHTAQNKAPFYRLKVEINDRPEITELTKGNFYFAFTSNGGRAIKAQSIVDPALVFGEDMAFQNPQAFISEDSFILPREQMGNNKYPSAMSFFEQKLQAGKSVSLYSVIGHIESEGKLNAFVARKMSAEYFERKAAENREIIDNLTGVIGTKSGVEVFDLYCRQTYLDNVMRGGMPIMLPAGDKEIVYYVYSRKHGDMERDYNQFYLSPSYYSQGNGSYRDMNQNKRSDVYFYPQINDFNVEVFFNLIQLDGYNPLVVKGATFCLNLKTGGAEKLLGKSVKKKSLAEVKKFFTERYEPGGLLLMLEEKGIELNVTKEEFLAEVLGASEQILDSEHGEGFWVDHWTYNLDLLESYIAIYPEKLKHVLFEKKDFTYFDNVHVVAPRSEKYVNAAGKIRQFDSVVIDTNKSKLIRSRAAAPHLMREKNGTGSVYKTTLMGKITTLIVNKIATLDPDGIGIEMEAEKPGWYDALNGLPGVFGSSVCEVFELKRMVRYLQDSLACLRLDGSDGINIPVEVYGFLSGIEQLLAKKTSSFDYWNKSAALKEKYRKETALGVDGTERLLTIGQLNRFLGLASEKLSSAIAKAKDKKTGLYFTYFSYEAVSYKPNKMCSHKGWQCVGVQKFKGRPLPLFLEAEVHYLKTEAGRQGAAKFYSLVKKSPLFDKHLGMYKVNASLKKEPMDIGRATVFLPGWLENESIWLHMEYKYILELLKSGLYKEFYAEFKKAGVCFLKPDVYGRSILENSSFIVSSAYPDKNNWGRGFVARLSGSTAEFIEMWLVMTCGSKPFSVGSDGKLSLCFKPALSKEFFTEKKEFSFVFLGKTKVVYHNPSKRDLFGESCKVRSISITWNSGEPETVSGSVIIGEKSEKIREQEAERIDVYFA
jgi:hypothetical protein